MREAERQAPFVHRSGVLQALVKPHYGAPCTADLENVLKWGDLEPDRSIVKAIQDADKEMSDKRRPAVDAGQNVTRRWSELFSRACARMIATALRSHKGFSGKARQVFPTRSGEGLEKLTPLGQDEGKRIDVVAAGPLTGLEVGVSLKALNFPNARGYHDHNLTGRLYELRDEVSLVHQYLPRAWMAALFFLPIQATMDKVRGPSSYARTIEKLRKRTGRLDPDFPGHAFRCDSSAVVLYVPGIDGDPFQRGVYRIFDCETEPPQLGLPSVDGGYTLNEWVSDLVTRVRARARADMGYSQPEPWPGE